MLKEIEENKEKIDKELYENAKTKELKYVLEAYKAIHIEKPSKKEKKGGK